MLLCVEILPYMENTLTHVLLVRKKRPPPVPRHIPGMQPHLGFMGPAAQERLERSGMTPSLHENASGLMLASPSAPVGAFFSHQKHMRQGFFHVGQNFNAKWHFCHFSLFPFSFGERGILHMNRHIASFFPFHHTHTNKAQKTASIHIYSIARRSISWP